MNRKGIWFSQFSTLLFHFRTGISSSRNYWKVIIVISPHYLGKQNGSVIGVRNETAAYLDL